MNYYDLTNPQKSIWSMEQYYKDTNINNICGLLTINKKVDFDILNKSINIFVQNNKSFGINFKEENGKLYQFFVNQEEIDYEIVKLRDYLDAKNLAKEVSKYVFNIYDKKLYKFIIYELENGHGGFITLTHHIISDAATIALMGTEVIDIYKKLLKNENIDAKDYSYEEYIQSEKEYLNSSKFETDKKYWNELYSTVPEVASVPSTSFNNSMVLTGKSKRKEFIIEEELLNKIADFCKENKVSNFNFFMSIYAIYLSRVSNLKDFVIGTPILNRTNFVEKHTTGMFINTAPLRICLDDNLDFKSFVKKICQSSFDLLRHQKYPYELLLKNLRNKESGLPALFDVILSYQITKANDGNSEVPYEVEWVPTSTISNGIDIHLHDNNNNNTLNVAYDYQTQKYKEEDIDNMHNRVLHIIKQVLENTDILEQDIEIVTHEEKNQILYEFNNTRTIYPKHKTIIQLFEEQVEKNPDNIAVVFDDKKLTYKELNEKANSLALYLQNKDVSLGNVVCMLFDKSLEMVVSILATLKLGACYLPIDIGYPEDRIDYIIKDSNAKIVLTTKTVFLNLSSDINCLCVDLDNINIYNTARTFASINNTSCEDIAYIMYTSGSTGRPKGVMVKNINVVRLVKNTNFINFSQSERILQTGSIVFDACTFEIWGALLNGFELYIIKKEELLDSSLLCDYLLKNKISILWLTSPLFNKLCEDNPNIFSSIKYLLTGGDILSPKHINLARAKNPNLTIINGYGPTENTTFSTCFTINNTFKNTIPIGSPIANSTAYIVSTNGSLLPVGISGELWVGGDGVSAGYLNNPELTNEKFIENPFGDGIIYKTGDLAKWLPDGNIEFIGRIDNQVKIRGFRVELSEINNILSHFPNIRECATIVSETQGKKSISSYFVANNNVAISKEEIKSYLKESLPSYMIPTYFCQLDKLPLNINGKIDKSKLPEPSIDAKEDIVKPKNQIEKDLLSIFKTVLNLESISTTDSFFELGGDSLLAINLTFQIHEKLNTKINIQTLFENPSIAQLATLISDETGNLDVDDKISKCETKEFYNISSAQRRIYYSCKMAGEESTLYNMPGIITFDKKPDLENLNECFKILIQRHSSLRTYFEVNGEEVYQKIEPHFDFKIEKLLTEGQSTDEIIKSFVKPFDLSKLPLFRIAFTKNEDKYLLLFDMHHIICDGSSLALFANELSALYNGKTLDKLDFDYIDYAEWEFNNIKNNSLKESKEFWLNEFKNAIPVLDFPTDFVRPSVQSFDGAKIYKTISEKLVSSLKSLSKELNVSIFMLLLSSYYVLLSKYSNAKDVVVGTPVIGRDRKEFSDIMGMFVNTLPLKTHIDDNMSFKDFLDTVKSTCTKAISNETYPFDELVKDLDITRDISRSSLFDTMFIYQNNGMPSVTFDNIKTDIIMPETNISKFDLSLEVIPKDNSEFSLNFEYCTNLFKKETVERLSSHFINILNFIVNNYEAKIKDIEMLSSEEKNKILCEFNNTKMYYPQDKTISELFEEQVEKTPNNIAVVFEDKSLTYKELNEKANALALYLRNNKIGRNDIVSIMVNRSLELLVAILAVLKSGACYIPIDPNYPKDRTEYMLENSHCKLLLTSSSLYASIDFDKKIVVDFSDNYFTNNISNLPNINLPEDTSYIIYTSGSTGKPKGVVLKQKSLTNLAYFLNDYVCFLKDNKYIAMASVTTASFDIFIFETLIALQRGLKVVIANEEEQRLPSRLNTFIKNNDIKAIQMTPSRMRIFIDNFTDCPNLSNLDYVVLAGEPLPNNLLKDLLNLGIKKVYNGYGPSETTVFSSFTDVTDYEVVNIRKTSC